MFAFVAPLPSWTESIVSLGCAELFMLLAHGPEVKILFKKDSQLSSKERKEIEGGLARSVLVDGIVFVPASIVLMLIIIRPMLLTFLPWARFTASLPSNSMSGLLGIIGYQFPFITVKKVVMRMALITLRNCATIVIQEDNPNPKDNEHEDASSQNEGDGGRPQ
jgi:hypothetical protein